MWHNPSQLGACDGYCIYFYGYARVTVILLRLYRCGALEHKDTLVDLTLVYGLASIRTEYRDTLFGARTLVVALWRQQMGPMA